MNSLLNITAKIDQPVLLEGLVEELARRRHDYGYSDNTKLRNWKAIDTSSIESYIEGTMSLKDGNEGINMPYITSFLFSCSKEIGGDFELTWSISLS